MSHERTAREMSEAELRAIIAEGLVGKSTAQVREFAQSIGISAAQLRELVSPTVPTPER